MSYLEAKKIKVFNWQAESPDLSPIEEVWGFVKNELWKIRYELKSKE